MNLQNQIIALWVAVILLAGYIIFLQQKRSYYVPPVGNVITMMNLQEYSSLSSQQKDFYVSQLNAAGPRLLMSSNNMTMYQGVLTDIMGSAFNMQTLNTTETPVRPELGRPGIITDTSTINNIGRPGLGNNTMGTQ